MSCIALNEIKDIKSKILLSNLKKINYRPMFIFPHSEADFMRPFYKACYISIVNTLNFSC